MSHPAALELYNIRRAELAGSGLRCLSHDGLFYYSAHLGEHWEAVFLDAYEHALIGIPEEHPGYRKAEELLRVQNPNVLAHKQGGDWFNGLPVERHRYVPFNGGMSSEQLAWLEKALSAAKAERRNVLIFTHVPLYRPATKPKTIVWNCEEVLAVLHKHKDTVVAVLAGHDHDGGYAVDPAGLHHITMNSALTATPGTDCFAILECHDDGWAHFRAHGRACVESDTRGEGRAYPELILAKGAENQPSSIADRAFPANGVETTLQDALAQLKAMGFPQEEASAALAASGGSVQAASDMLCG